MGYSTEAFQQLRKVVSIPNIAECKSEKGDALSHLPTVPISLPSTYSIGHAVTKPATTVAAKTIFSTNQLQTKSMLIPGVSTTGKTFSLVTTTPTTSGNLIFLTQTSTSNNSIDSIVKLPTKIITTVASPGKVVKVRLKNISIILSINSCCFEGCPVNCFTVEISHVCLKIRYQSSIGNYRPEFNCFFGQSS